MRRSGKIFGVAAVALFVLGSVLASAGLGLVPTASAHGASGQSNHALAAAHPLARSTPAVGPAVTVRVTSSIPASPDADFGLAYSISVVNPAVPLNGSNTSNTWISVAVWLGHPATTLTTNNTVTPDTVALTDPGTNTWTVAGVADINGAFLSGNGSVVAPTALAGQIFSFDVWASILGTNASSGITSSATIPTAALTYTAPTDLPTGTTVVPFNFTYGAAVSGATEGNVSAVLTITQNGTLIASGPLAIDPTSAGTQSATVDYNFLALGGLSSFPSGVYNLSLYVSVTSAFGSSANNSATGGAGPSIGLVTISTVNVAIVQSSLALYQNLPTTVTWNFTPSQTVAVTAANINLSIEVIDLFPACSVLFAVPCGVVNWQNVPVTSGTSSVSFSLTPQFLYEEGYQLFDGSPVYNGSNTSTASLPTADKYSIITYANITDPSVGIRSASTAQESFLVFDPATASVNASQSTIGIVSGGFGNVTIAATYGGQFIGGATVNVTSAAGTLVFSHGVFLASGTANRTVVAQWSPTQNGTYTVDLILTIANGTSVVKTTSVAVISNSNTVTVKTTTYHNTTLFGGLNAGESAALLLVIGLIVGMIVALLLGRMMWGTPKTTTVQQWQQTTTTGTHECSVCHQTFQTEAELQEHAKSAHGISS
jgi:hypothetical protein